MAIIQVSIPNWDKYNPRADRAVHTWFRFQNAFFSDQKMFGLSDSQLLLFVFLKCECSKNLGGVTEINTEYVAAVRRTNESKVLADLRALADLGVITLPNGGEQTPKGNATYERTNDTNVTNTIAQPDGFAEFWSGMPRKVGKGKTEKLYRAAIKAGASAKDLLAARDKYREYLIREGTESKYIKHGPTFMASWRDWLDPETGQAEDFAQKEPSLVDLQLPDYGSAS